MKFRIYFKHMPSSLATSTYAQEKLGECLTKYALHVVDAHLTFCADNGDFRATCHILAEGGIDLTLEQNDRLSMRAAIDGLAAKLDGALRRKVERLHSHRKPPMRTEVTQTLGMTVLLLLFACLRTPQALADDPSPGELVNVNARTVFVPIGFDDNDETEVIVEGYLPNGCYRLTQPEILVDHAAMRISVRPMARFFDAPCVDMLVPYFFEAKVGQLTQGNYTVEVVGADSTLTERVPVRHAFGPGPDDFSYVPVDDVKVELDRVNHQMVATVRGRFTSSCMRWVETRLEDNGKTINLLPILAIDDLENCDQIEAPYERQVVLPASISRGRHLLHVRTMNGQAINTLFFKLEP